MHCHVAMDHGGNDIETGCAVANSLVSTNPYRRLKTDARYRVPRVRFRNPCLRDGEPQMILFCPGTDSLNLPAASEEIALTFGSQT